MSFNCSNCKFGYHKLGFFCGKGILYITKNYNKNCDCLAYKEGNTRRKKAREVLIQNIKELVR